MSRPAAVLAAAAALAAATICGEAQSRPDLSGTWAVVRVEAGAGGLNAGYKKGDRLTLTQTGDALIVTDPARGIVSRYPFDGSELVNPDPAGGTIRTWARWEGLALAVEGWLWHESPQGKTSFQTRQAWSTSADRLTLTLATTSRQPSGPAWSIVTFSRVAP